MCGLVLFLALSSLCSTFSPQWMHCGCPRQAYGGVCMCVWDASDRKIVFRNSTFVRWVMRSCLVLNLSFILCLFFWKHGGYIWKGVFLWRSIRCLSPGKELTIKKENALPFSHENLWRVREIKLYKYINNVLFLTGILCWWWPDWPSVTFFTFCLCLR